jgi:hypothetical protein
MLARQRFDREVAVFRFVAERVFVFARDAEDFLRDAVDLVFAFVFVLERDAADLAFVFVFVLERDAADLAFVFVLVLARDAADLAFVFVLVFDRELAAFVLVFAFDRAAVFFREPALREADVLRDDDRLRAPVLDCDPSSDESSSSEPMSFFATPTAAGIATPRAVPATTFVVVDSPSSSSFDISTSRSLRFVIGLLRFVERFDELRHDALAQDLRSMRRDVLAGGLGCVVGEREQHVGCGFPARRGGRSEDRRRP